MRLAAWVAVSAGAALCLLTPPVVARAWEGIRPGEPLVPLLVLALFVASPYAPLAGAVALAKGRAAEALVLAGTVLGTSFGLVVYVDAFFRRDNPLHVFLFLSVPALQWGGGLAVLGVVALLRLADRRRLAAARRAVG